MKAMDFKYDSYKQGEKKGFWDGFIWGIIIAGMIICLYYFWINFGTDNIDNLM